MKNIGFATSLINSNITETVTHLEKVYEAGFSHYEIEITNASIMAGSRWIPKRKNDFVKGLLSVPISYSIHLPMVLDLGDPNLRFEDAQNIIKAFIELSHELNNKDMVLHPTRHVHHISSIQEINYLKKLEPLFREADIVVHIENVLNKRLGGEYIHNVSLRDNLSILRELNSDVFGYCLDVGHANINAAAQSENLIDEIEFISASVTHLHLHDNLGNPLNHSMNRHEAMLMGKGDMHMPPMWGTIPYGEILQPLKDYKGKVVLEIFQDYLDDLHDIYQTADELLNG